MGPAASVASSTFSRIDRRAPMGAIGFVLALLVTATAFGQSDPTKKRAQALQVEGLGLLQKGDSRAALEKFDEAFRLVPSPKILFNRGKAHRALGEDVAALADFERFLDEAPYAPKESRVEAERAVQALRPKLAYLEIQVDDVGVTISVDGREIGAAPLSRPVVVAPGTHEVRVAKSGMNDDVRSVSPIAGQKLRVVVKLTVAVASAPARVAPTETTATTTPAPAPMRAPAASAVAPAAPPPTDVVVTTGNQQPDPRASERPWQITAAWVTAGAGVLFLGAGITAQVLTSAKYDEFNDVHTAPAPAPDGRCNKTLPDSGGGPCQGLLDAAEQRQKLAIAGYVAGGVSLAGALIFYLAAPSSSAGHDVAAACSPNQLSGVSCALTLRF
jgi:hypothetical protein